METNFPIIPSDRADDLHHLEYADGADLVLFMAGNQFMAMEEIIAEFRSEYPEVKRDKGTTLYTVVHHRETPLRIAEKTVDVGPVWATEAAHAATVGFNFDVVEPGEELDRRKYVNYYLCKLSRSPNAQNAQKFLAFIRSSIPQKIYRTYGFINASDV